MFADFDRRDDAERVVKMEKLLADHREQALLAKVGDVWFRYDEKTYASCDPYDEDRYSFNTQIEITRFKVVRVTPKGVQLAGSGYSARRPRLVLHESYKRFACATVELALDSYLKRKQKQEAIYAARAKKAKDCAFQARQGRVKYVNDPDKIPMTYEKGTLTW